MRIGAVDGHNEVYTPLGILIFEPDEKLIKRLPDKKFCLGTQWRGWFFDSVFIGAWGKGSLFITDRRIVFIRRPMDPIQISYTFGATQGFGGMGREIAEGMEHSRAVNACGGFDYVEIRYEDIAFLKRGFICQKLCILSNGKRFQSPLDGDAYQLILPILKERNIRIKRSWFARGKKINAEIES